MARFSSDINMKNICGFIENHDTTNQWENEDLQDNADLFEQGTLSLNLIFLQS